MFKKAARFHQRAGLLAGLGLSRKNETPSDETEKFLSPVERFHLNQKIRLARIRRAFELEQQIAENLRIGRNVAALKEELAKVKSGEIKVPLSLAKDPRPAPDFVGITSSRKAGPALVSHSSRPDRRPKRRPLITRAQAKGSLRDLAKSKLTLDSIAIIKVMLDRFDISDVSSALGISELFLEKARQSPVYLSAPEIGTQDALVVIEILEERLADITPGNSGAYLPDIEVEPPQNTPEPQHMIATSPVARNILSADVEKISPSELKGNLDTHTSPEKLPPILIPQGDVTPPGDDHHPGKRYERSPEDEEELQRGLQALEDLYVRRSEVITKLSRQREAVIKLESELTDIDAQLEELLKSV